MTMPDAAGAPDADAIFERWLGGIRPAWALLPREVVEALLVADPLGEGGPVRVRADLPPAELAGSIILRHARLVLETLQHDGGAKLTAKGNLGRAFVAAMVEQFDWPEHGREEVYRFNKVVNEPDFLPLHFLHPLLREAGLARRFKGKLVIARQGRELLPPNMAGALQARLLTILFSRMNLGFLDGWPSDRFPRNQLGLVLFLLGQTASAWRSPRHLVRSCALPDGVPLDPPPETPGSRFDAAASIFELRVLRFLFWFGLLERRLDPASQPGDVLAERQYRKTPLFDRSLGFALPGLARQGPVH